MDHARDAAARNGDHDEQDDAPSAPVVATIMPATASARLRAAREAKGMTIAAVAAQTRITQRHVEALDRGDLAALPGRPYVVGFVRSYARAVGLNEADLVALVRHELDSFDAPPAPKVLHQYDVEDPAKTPSRLVTGLALALLAAVLVAGGIFWRSYYAPGAELPSLALPDPAPSAAPAPRPAPVAAPAADGPVVFTAAQDQIWVKFYDGHGQQLLQKVLAKGESYTVPADAFEPKLWTGRPDALTVTVGGRALPPLADHQMLMRDVPVTGAALVARATAPVTPPVAPSAVPPAAPHAPRHHREAPADAGDNPAPAPVAADPAPAPTASTPQ
jgi:transcriptional regulator with XRE-family HTH domain